MASQSALTVVGRGERFALNRADLQRFPDSLLHGLCIDFKAAEPINIDVTSSQDSPFTWWKAAVPLTVGVYRNGVFPTATLSELLATHTAKDLFDRLTKLCDYLALPSPLTKLLPDRATVPLMYGGVHELYAHALASAAANCILLSTAFSNSGKTHPDAVAMFYITHGDPELSVYAVWPADAKKLLAEEAVEAKAWQLDSMGKAGSLHLVYDLSYGSTVIKQRDDPLAAPLAAALRKAVKDVPVRGSIGVMRVECVEVQVFAYNRTNSRLVPVWVVKW